MEFKAHIDGRVIHCQITVDRDLSAPVFCFSGMAPMTALSGGEKIRGVGSYTEVQLDDLRAGQPFDLTIAHAHPDYSPTNRAWLPLGAYLRAGADIIELPKLPAGVKIQPRTTPESADPLALRLCPQPARFEATGEHVQVSTFTCDHSELEAADALCQRTGLGAFLGEGGIPLAIHEASDLPAEGYQLTIRSDGIELLAADRAGVLYGAITLATLRKTHDGALPCGVIEDAPRFEWRGQHLDCARHFFEVGTILRLLDVMALLKMNRFHWHFADDESVRLELNCAPELAQTHFRGEGQLIPGVFGGGIRSGGCYSHDDARQVIAHARALNIEVMPEIEVPAHAYALAKVYPETRDPLDQGKEVSVQGYATNVMNPAMPESWRLWNAIVQEVAALFPFGVVHLGADELPPDTWKGSPAADALKAREGLETAEDLLGWTLNQVHQTLAQTGTQAASWEEAALGKIGIGTDAILFSWTGQGPGLTAARQGYRVVMTPAQHLYLDMAQTRDTDDWGASWAAIVGLADTIAWDPVPDAEPELEERIIGVQSTFWGEFTTVDQEIEPMLAPRILGSAIMGWQARKSCDTDTLEHLAHRYRAIFDAMGWASS